MKQIANSSEKRFKKYSNSTAFIFSFAALIVSVISLKQGCNSNTFEKKLLENSLNPKWYVESTYSANNIDLVSVTIKSRLEGVMVKNLTIISPSDLHIKEPIKVIGDKWNTFDFLNRLNRTIENYFYIPEPDIFQISKTLARYPIAIKIDYWQNDKRYSSTYIFILHLRIFGKEKIKIFKVEPDEYVGDLDNDALVNKVDILNKNVGILADYQSATSSHSELPMRTTQIGMQIVNLSKSITQHEIVHMTENEVERIDTVRIPSFVMDLQMGDSLLNAIHEINKFKNQFSPDLLNSMEEISNFVVANPLLRMKEQRNAFLQTSSWINNKKTASEWSKIMFRLHVAILDVLNTQINDFNKSMEIIKDSLQQTKSK